MFNRTLRRPMFRRGGKAEGGITSGLRRQGYVHGGDIDDHTNASGSYFKPDNTMSNNMSDMTKVTSQRDLINELSPRYNNQGSDFFMGLGANILAAPGGNPILQTLGTAAREPLAQMAKTNMANVSGKREVAMAMWNNMDEDTKTRMMKDAQYLVDQGVFPNIQEALKSEIYSKQKSPQAKKDARIKDLENIIISKDVGGSLTEVAQDIANHVYNIQTGVYDGAVDQNGNPLSFAKQRSYFKDGDISRQGTKDDGTMLYELTPNGLSKWESYEGLAVYDYRTGKLFKKQGNNFVEVIVGEKIEE